MPKLDKLLPKSPKYVYVHNYTWIEFLLVFIYKNYKT